MTLHAQEAEMPLPSCPATRNRLEPQAPYFQWYLRKSLWKKRPGLGKLRLALSRSAPSEFNLNQEQAYYYQHYEGDLRIVGHIQRPNQSSHFFSHLLHSSRRSGWLKVTSSRLCRVHPNPVARLGSPSFAARIVPLTRPISGTILAEPTHGVPGERPRKFFRE